MTVKQYMRPFRAGMSDDHWMTRGYALSGIKANGLKIFNQPIGGFVTVFAISRIRGNAGNTQQFKEMFGRLFNVSVNMSQNRVKHS
jgi:hypothetical protein